MEHHCHAHGCTVEVPPIRLMCLRHWRMVPKPMQAKVWSLYVPGQEKRKDPTPEYTAYTDLVINYVRDYESTVAAAQSRQGKLL